MPDFMLYVHAAIAAIAAVWCLIDIYKCWKLPYVEEFAIERRLRHLEISFLAVVCFAALSVLLTWFVPLSSVLPLSLILASAAMSVAILFGVMTYQVDKHGVLTGARRTVSAACLLAIFIVFASPAPLLLFAHADSFHETWAIVMCAIGALLGAALMYGMVHRIERAEQSVQ